MMRTSSVRPNRCDRKLTIAFDFAYQVSEDFGFEKIKFELSVKGSDTSKQ